MLRRFTELTGFGIHARDGEIGRVKDLYFEDQGWTIRHLIADTGQWLPKRKVLISPFAVNGVDALDKTVDVALTKQQIESSPPIDADMPVSRQMEERYHSYYGWPYYWEGPYVWGPFLYPRVHGFPPGDSAPNEKTTHSGDPHLRSASEVKGYRLRTRDDEFGRVTDFVFDEGDWRIRYIVADTSNWLPGKHVLVPTQWLSEIHWHRQHIHVELDRETVRRAPEYDSDQPITREYEERLFQFYEREPYWQGRPERHAA